MDDINLKEFHKTGLYFHKNIFYDLKIFLKDITNAGFFPKIISSHRSFERQLEIWNEKAQGKRKLYDSKGVLIEGKQLAHLQNQEKLELMLKWSAIPKFSRHHWGTDFDLVATNSIQESNNYPFKLIPEEFEKGGVSYKFHNWMNHKILETNFPFRRPYFDISGGGLAPEPWHFSHKETALQFEEDLQLAKFCKIIKDHPEICFQELILENSKEIYTQYISLYFS